MCKRPRLCCLSGTCSCSDGDDISICSSPAWKLQKSEAGGKSADSTRRSPSVPSSPIELRVSVTSGAHSSCSNGDECECEVAGVRERPRSPPVTHTEKQGSFQGTVADNAGRQAASDAELGDGRKEAGRDAETSRPGQESLHEGAMHSEGTESHLEGSGDVFASHRSRVMVAMAEARSSPSPTTAPLARGSEVHVEVLLPDQQAVLQKVPVSSNEVFLSCNAPQRPEGRSIRSPSSDKPSTRPIPNASLSRPSPTPSSPHVQLSHETFRRTDPVSLATERPEEYYPTLPTPQTNQGASINSGPLVTPRTASPVPSELEPGSAGSRKHPRKRPSQDSCTEADPAGYRVAKSKVARTSLNVADSHQAPSESSRASSGTQAPAEMPAPTMGDLEDLGRKNSAAAVFCTSVCVSSLCRNREIPSTPHPEVTIAGAKRAERRRARNVSQKREDFRASASLLASVFSL